MCQLMITHFCVGKDVLKYSVKPLKIHLIFILRFLWSWIISQILAISAAGSTFKIHFTIQNPTGKFPINWAARNLLQQKGINKLHIKWAKHSLASQSCVFAFDTNNWLNFQELLQAFHSVLTTLTRSETFPAWSYLLVLKMN